MAMKPVTGKLRKGGGKGASGDALVGNVTQSTINSIKKMGMTEALKLAGKNGKTSGGMAREFQEGVRRMYGAKRLEAAKAKYAPAEKPKFSTASRPPMANKPTPKPAAKNNTKSNLLKGVGGAVAGIGVLAASKGKGAAVAAKLSPAVGRVASSTVGKAVFGTGEKLTNKAFSTSGRVTAKAGRPVSQSQYEAMIAAAKAKGIKPLVKAPAKSADAARAAATKKKPKLGKAGIAATGAGQTNKK
jgi:hypothetical protein